MMRNGQLFPELLEDSLKSCYDCRSAGSSYLSIRGCDSGKQNLISYFHFPPPLCFCRLFMCLGFGTETAEQKNSKVKAPQES